MLFAQQLFFFVAGEDKTGLNQLEKHSEMQFQTWNNMDGENMLKSAQLDHSRIFVFGFPQQIFEKQTIMMVNDHGNPRVMQA